MNIERYKKWYFIVPAALVGIPIVAALFVLIGGGIVMLLWNWLLPPLFAWPRLTLLQAFGLLVLCRTLFGGWGSGGGRQSKHMSREERERFRRRVRSQDSAGRQDGAPEASRNDPPPGAASGRE